MFHKEVKSYLGFTEARVMKFEAMESHIYWVYIAYLLLFDLVEDEDKSILSRMQQIKMEVEQAKSRQILQLLSRFNGEEAVKKHFYQEKLKCTPKIAA